MKTSFLNFYTPNFPNTILNSSFRLGDSSIFNCSGFNSFNNNTFTQKTPSFLSCFGLGLGMGLANLIPNIFNFNNFGLNNMWFGFPMMNFGIPMMNVSDSFERCEKQDNISSKRVYNKHKTQHIDKDISDKTLEEDKAVRTDSKKKSDKPQKKVKLENSIENDCENKVVADELERIAKVVLKKYIKTGKFGIKDLPIERVNAQITSVDISGRYDLNFGTKNDYRDDNGNIVRVADGTVITVKYKYNDKEYTCKIKSKLVTKKGIPKSYTEKSDVKLNA